MKRVIIILVLASFGIFSAGAQHTNNGATLTIQSGLNVYASGNIVNAGSGIVNNSGTIHLDGNWTNNASTAGFGGSGTLKLIGQDQTCGGSSATTYHDLLLEGTGVKTLSANANINGTLALNDRELHAQGNTVTINSTSTNAITRSNGFISNTLGGAVARKTASTSAYLFPVGSNQSGYLPVEVAPVLSSAHTFSVRLADGDASSEGYDINSTDGAVGTLNAYNFYHINRTAGSGNANISIYFSSLSGVPFSRIGHWNGSLWQNATPATASSGSPLSKITLSNWGSFSPFILAHDPFAVPTMGEWGLIILGLLTLTLATLFMGQRQLALAGGRVSFGFSEVIRTAPFDKIEYLKILKTLMVIVFIGFAAIHLLIGTNGMVDFFGTFVSTFIVAYLIFLYKVFDGFKES